jgi:hypothetical protein
VWKKLWELLGQRKHDLVWTGVYDSLSGNPSAYVCTNCEKEFHIPSDFLWMRSRFKGCRPKRKEDAEGWYKLDGK